MQRCGTALMLVDAVDAASRQITVADCRPQSHTTEIAGLSDQGTHTGSTCGGVGRTDAQRHPIATVLQRMLLRSFACTSSVCCDP